MTNEKAQIADKGPMRNTRPRLSLNLSDKVRADLDQLSKKTGWSLTEIVRQGLGLVKFVSELSDEEKLGVFNKEGKLVREVYLPWARQ